MVTYLANQPFGCGLPGMTVNCNTNTDSGKANTHDSYNWQRCHSLQFNPMAKCSNSNGTDINIDAGHRPGWTELTGQRDYKPGTPPRPILCACWMERGTSKRNGKPPVELCLPVHAPTIFPTHTISIPLQPPLAAAGTPGY